MTIKPLFAALGAAALASQAIAATTTASFPASITVDRSCTVTGGNALDFGTVGTAETDITADTTITVNCSNGTAYTVGLVAASNPGGITGTGNFNVGGTLIPYSLYQDDSQSEAWGNNTAAGTENVKEGTGDGSDQVLTVYGYVANIPDVDGDTYTDTVNITVTY